MSIVRLLIVVLTVLWPLAAQAVSPSRAEYQYIEAIRRGEIAKARDLASLANINPMNIAGLPVASWVIERGDGGIFYMKDESYAYLFDELNISTNAPWREGSLTTLFAQHCNVMTNFYDNRGKEGLHKTLRRMVVAMDKGANVMGYDKIQPHEEKWRPLPMCARSYISMRDNPFMKERMLKLLETLILRGADANTENVIFKSAEVYDVELFNLLVKYGARFRQEFNPRDTGSQDGVCRTKAALPNNSILATLPNPRDADTERAKAIIGWSMRLTFLC